MVQAIQKGLKLNGTHQLLVYADDVDTWGESVHTVKKNTENIVVDGKDIGLEVDAGKTKHLARSRDQNAGRSHNIKTDIISFEWVEQGKYLGTKLMNQNSIQTEVRKCFLSIGAGTFVFQFAIQKIQRLRYREI